MEQMSVKQRLLAAIRGQTIDRLPWSPFLAYYWDFMPQDIIEQGQFAYLKSLGADPLLRGFHRLFEVKRKQCTISDVTNGNMRCVTYDTPVGSIREEYTFASISKTWFLTGHPVRCEDDLKILQYVYENTVIVPNAKEFEQDQKCFGEAALLLPVIGTHFKTGIQSMVEHWLGTEELSYALQDYPEAIEECLAVMYQRDRETVEASLDSSAEGFIFWEDSSTTNLSPSMFEQYALPQINEWGKMIHAQNKLLVHHACGHIRDLLPLMATSEIDAIESISPPPTGNVTIEEAFAGLPQHIALIGGIEPTVLLNSSMDNLRVYVQELIHVAQNRRFVLANSDSCPPNVDEEKFRMISQLVCTQQ